jgi:hypothetical protein
VSEIETIRKALHALWAMRSDSLVDQEGNPTTFLTHEEWDQARAALDALAARLEAAEQALRTISRSYPMHDNLSDAETAYFYWETIKHYREIASAALARQPAQEPA